MLDEVRWALPARTDLRVTIISDGPQREELVRALAWPNSVEGGRRAAAATSPLMALPLIDSIKPCTIVSFHAHPDDEALFTGGTRARAAAEGTGWS
jgi:hypothetical protein